MSQNRKNSNSSQQTKHAEKCLEDPTKKPNNKPVDSKIGEKEIQMEEPEKLLNNLQLKGTEGDSESLNLKEKFQNDLSWLADRFASLLKIMANALSWLAALFTSLVKIMTTAIILIVLVCFLYSIYQELKTESVLIDPFEVPEDFKKQGYNGRVIANRLIDQIIFIRVTAKARKDSMIITPIWSQKEVEIEVAGIKIPLNYSYRYIKKFFGQEPTRIVGEIVIHNDSMYSTVRVRGETAETIRVELENLDEDLLQAAIHVSKYIHPYVLACYFYKINEKACLETIRYILSAEPHDDDHKALVLWGIILRDQGDYKGAIDKFQEAIAIEPKYAAAYSNWGIVLTYMGDYDGAIDKHQKAIKLDPIGSSTDLLWNLIISLSGSPA